MSNCNDVPSDYVVGKVSFVVTRSCKETVVCLNRRRSLTKTLLESYPDHSTGHFRLTPTVESLLWRFTVSRMFPFVSWNNPVTIGFGGHLSVGRSILFERSVKPQSTRSRVPLDYGFLSRFIQFYSFLSSTVVVSSWLNRLLGNIGIRKFIEITFSTTSRTKNGTSHSDLSPFSWLQVKKRDSPSLRTINSGLFLNTRLFLLLLRRGIKDTYVTYE